MKRIISIITLILAISCSGNEQPDATGTFEAVEVVVSAESNGRIIEFTVSEGDELKAGQILGYTDTVQLYLQKQRLLASDKAVLSRMQDVPRQIAAIKQQLATLQTEKARYEKLIALNAGNTKQLDDINAQIAFYNKQLDAQASTLQNSNSSMKSESNGVKIQIQQVEDQLNKCYLRSPIDGTLLTKYAECGEFAYQGKPLFKVADTRNLILRAYLNGSQLARVKIGQTVKITADAGKGVYEGKITSISDKAEFTPKTIQTKEERENLVYAVKVSVPNDGYLKIGMYGDLFFKGK
jgi:HlyD family secretion protein